MNLIGRETEYNTITSYVRGAPPLSRYHSLCICGSPGTGKTFIARMAVDACEHIRYLEINAMSVKGAPGILARILDFIGGEGFVSTRSKYAKKPGTVLSMIQQVLLFEPEPKKVARCVIIIDEIDALLKSTKYFSQILSLPRLTEGRLSVIAISNTIDVSMRLEDSKQIVQGLVFRPYTHMQLMDIIRSSSVFTHDSTQEDSPATNLLTELDQELISRKIASAHGDCRRAISMCREIATEKKIRCDHGTVVASREDSPRGTHYSKTGGLANIVERTVGIDTELKNAIKDLSFPLKQCLCAISVLLISSRSDFVDLVRVKATVEAFTSKFSFPKPNMVTIIEQAQILEGYGILRRSKESGRAKIPRHKSAAYDRTVCHGTTLEPLVIQEILIDTDKIFCRMCKTD